MCISVLVPRMSEAALGGGKCNIPPSGSGYPGASTICTAGENGFCLIDHFTVTGTNPVTLVTVEGVCVCRYGYSGPQCASKFPGLIEREREAERERDRQTDRQTDRERHIRVNFAG